MNISAHISYSEATKSQTAIRKGIDNTPSPFVLERMKLVAERVFEPLREHFGIPIAVTSFYRSPKLNRAIGGVKSSQHVTGEAMDIDGHIFGGVTNREIFEWVKNNLEYDQVIWEYGDESEPAWVHVSYREWNNRGIVVYLR